MKLNMERLEAFDHIEEIPPADSDDMPAKFYFRGSRDWLWDFATKVKDGMINLTVQEQYEFLVRIMVKWEGVFDAKRNLPIPFSEDKALQILRTFEIIPQPRIAIILMTVWNAVSDREDTLKNLLAEPTEPDGSAQDGSKSVSDTATTQSPTAKGAKKKTAKK